MTGATSRPESRWQRGGTAHLLRRSAGRGLALRLASRGQWRQASAGGRSWEAFLSLPCSLGPGPTGEKAAERSAGVGGRASGAAVGEQPNLGQLPGLPVLTAAKPHLLGDFSDSIAYFSFRLQVECVCVFYVYCCGDFLPS